MSAVFVLNGPNLNLLGTRETAIYGTATLADIEAALRAQGERLQLLIDFRQSNHEGDLVDWVQEAGGKGAGIIINPGAYTHTSIALHDALKAVRPPKIEVHLSNIHARESFRRTSHVSAAVDGVIVGLGAEGYGLALDAMRRLIDKVRR
ncbi:MAG: type II 3-dehydroquinate dehydratase [Parvularculaceae bacterium]|jgi:3-dehydroquinate dehydratase-2|nr:type II 3-dehydroquinate dehydratase [Parvularculaceae bacterium]